MKKIIIGLVVIAAIVIAGIIPYFVGKTAHENITAAVSNSDTVNAGVNGSIEIVSYDKGWLSSKAQYKWILPEPYAEHVASLDINCDATHGFTNYRYECLLDQTGDYGKFVSEKLGGIDPLSLKGSVDKAGNNHNKVMIKPFEIALEDDESFTMKEAIISIDSDANLANFTSKGAADGFNMNLTDGKISFGKLEFDSDMELFKEAIALGNTNATISSIEITNPDMTTSLEQVSVTSKTTQNDNLMGLVTDFSVNTLGLNAADEQHQIDNLTGNFDFQGVNVEAFIALQKSLQTLQDSSEENAQAYGEAYIALSEKIEALLLPGLSIAYDIEGNFNKGKASLDINTEILAPLSQADAQIVLFDPESVLDKLDINIKSAIPTSVIDLNPSIAATLDASGLFTQTDKGYAIDLKLNKDGSTLNGEETSISDLMGSLYVN